MAFLFTATIDEAAPAATIDRDELAASEWAPRDRAFALLDAPSSRRVQAALDQAPATAYLETP